MFINRLNFNLNLNLTEINKPPAYFHPPKNNINSRDLYNIHFYGQKYQNLTKISKFENKQKQHNLNHHDVYMKQHAYNKIINIPSPFPHINEEIQNVYLGKIMNQNEEKNINKEVTNKEVTNNNEIKLIIEEPVKNIKVDILIPEKHAICEESITSEQKNEELIIHEEHIEVETTKSEVETKNHLKLINVAMPQADKKYTDWKVEQLLLHSDTDDDDEERPDLFNNGWES